jgi:DNA replication and repair protein RecF
MIAQLVLNNFRIHQNLTLNFDAPSVLILGPNGSGKTSILESIYYLATTKSFRTKLDKALMNDQTSTFCRATLTFQDNTYQLLTSAEGKLGLINGVTQRRLSDYLGGFNAIIFSSQDLDLLKGSPADRRAFLDQLLSMVDRDYFGALTTYRQLLKEKNALLKTLSPHQTPPFGLHSLNQLVAKYGAVIAEKRAFYVGQLFPLLEAYPEHFTIAYETQVQSESQYLDLLTQKLSHEVLHQSAMYGIHKDDLIFSYHDALAKDYASQGQQKHAMINFKLALLPFFQRFNPKPIFVLLDDILSELDEYNQSLVLSHLPQSTCTIITSPIPLPFLDEETQIINL